MATSVDCVNLPSNLVEFNIKLYMNYEENRKSGDCKRDYCLKIKPAPF